MIDITGLDKVEVLTVLYDNARCQGLGVLHYREGSLSREEATEMLNKSTYFDYVYGRVMKVDLSSNQFNEYLYDRDNGAGAAKRAIDKLRNK